MNPKTFFHRLVNRFVNKPAPRKGWQAAVALEALEIRLNLSAVLIIETVDAYFLYDDVDALLKAASAGSSTNSSLSDPSSDFTPQELQVIDGLVAELIADEGYSDSDILAITYVDDTTSDELIAEGFFDEGFFDDGFFDAGDVTQTLADFVESTDLFETTDALFDLSDVSSNLTGAAGTDTISLGNGDLPLHANVRLGDQLTALVTNAVLPATEANSGASQVGQLASLIHDAKTQTEHQAIPSGPANREDVAESRTVLPPSLVTNAEAVALSVVTRMVSVSPLMLPFAKFPTADFTSAAIVSGLEYTKSLLGPRQAPNTDDAAHLDSDEAGQVSYSQIAAALGASGLVVARWLNAPQEFEGHSPDGQPRRRSRRTRQTSL